MKSLYTVLFSFLALVCFGQTELNEKLIDAELIKLTKQYSLNDDQKELVRPLLVVKQEGMLDAKTKQNPGLASKARVAINTDFHQSLNQIVTEEQKQAFLREQSNKRQAKMRDQKAGKSAFRSQNSNSKK